MKAPSKSSCGHADLAPDQDTILLATLFCVYAAGRIFRVGLLMQGKGAKVSDMVKWVFRG